ncbi:MAG: hypothetical protein EOO50_06730 [Flavobacterium sp.]|uniref:DUF6702 family protein n=1 Tax=Flavobacterium sp. TaxID=239 RepID=UPI0011F79040|nr:DUF6702 family protein [Flavobacterium sp.]RZJ67212.1 MAG: hypothetical protein EOO50_06730 [Flavobacterium sp.]
MKKIASVAVFLLLCVTLSSFAHKFYVGIFQVNFASDKKMIQVTSRIFVDDLNSALEKKFKKKFHFGDEKVPADEIPVLTKYISDNFTIAIDGVKKPLEYRSFEMENNVLIVYLRITDVAKVKSLDISNKILFDFVTEQQNIIQTNVNGEKANLLLTIDNPNGKLAF